jgi:hypothetical protein
MKTVVKVIHWYSCTSMSDYFRFAILKNNWTAEKTCKTADAYARSLPSVTAESLAKLQESLRQFLPVVEPTTMPTLFLFVDALIRENGVFARILLPELVANARCILPAPKCASEEHAKTQILKQLRSTCEGWRRDGFLSDDDFEQMWNSKRAQRTSFFRALFQKEDEAAAKAVATDKAEELDESFSSATVLEPGSRTHACSLCGDGFVRVFDDGANAWRLIDGFVDQEEVVVHDTCKQNRDSTLNATFAKYGRPAECSSTK